ncbi:hypothetical protein DM2_1484 [Halorubrum sp. DM2]|uniref:HalOD1 output domain-containing protein n=1 Tax=Halorubrum sp. DM2 TaxID=2527867 RepID=UPI0024B71AB8|nr:HalOD1 output domain-containing protein [Halorubrum sp. DM2]VTT88150.1 hypothetical protein DM2_1484 [Halorubrum sp. DM2]
MNRIEASGRGPAEVRTQYDWSVTSPSDAVVDAVSDAVDGGPTSFGPLYDRIDPDALNALFRSDAGDRTADGIRVSFSLAGRVVVVHGTGAVVVRTASGDGGDE